MRQAPNRDHGFEQAVSNRKKPDTNALILAPDRVILPKKDRRDPLARTRIMYIENKANGLNGRGRIGRVTFSKTGKTIYYDKKTFRSLNGGYKANFYDVATKEEYWISGPKKNGGDRLYGQPTVDIDEEVREEYWSEIRKRPSRVKDKTT